MIRTIVICHGDTVRTHIRSGFQEIMLQQTRVEAVKGYYARFLERLPDVQALAEVKEQELMKLWQGLGYYNRARNLKKAAQMIMTQYDGVFPDTYEELLKLPGIGEYTAGAIASIAFGRSVPAVDGNVYRIYTRLMARKDDIMQNAVRKAIRNEIAGMLPEKRAGDFNQAWMDLGADICIPNGMPLCEKCPLAKSCKMAGKEEVLAYPVKKKRKQERLKKNDLFVRVSGKISFTKKTGQRFVSRTVGIPVTGRKTVFRRSQKTITCDACESRDNRYAWQCQTYFFSY